MPQSKPQPKGKNKKKSRQEQKAETRQRIVRAGVDLLASGGFQEFTMNKIAKAAQISQPSFYVHFQSIEELLEEIASRLRKNVSEPLAKAMLEIAEAGLTENFRSSIYNFMRFNFDYALAFPGAFPLVQNPKTGFKPELEIIIERETQFEKNAYINLIKTIAQQQKVVISEENIMMAVDSVIIGNSVLMIGCIEGRYKNKNQAINMATDSIVSKMHFLLAMDDS